MVTKQVPAGGAVPLAPVMVYSLAEEDRGFACRGTPIEKNDFVASIFGLAVNASGSVVAVGIAGQVVLVDVKTAARIAETNLLSLYGNSPDVEGAYFKKFTIPEIQFANDGQSLVALDCLAEYGGPYFSLWILDSKNASPIAHVAPEDGAFSDVAWAIEPDGARLLAYYSCVDWGGGGDTPAGALCRDTRTGEAATGSAKRSGVALGTSKTFLAKLPPSLSNKLETADEFQWSAEDLLDATLSKIDSVQICDNGRLLLLASDGNVVLFDIRARAAQKVYGARFPDANTSWWYWLRGSLIRVFRSEAKGSDPRAAQVWVISTSDGSIRYLPTNCPDEAVPLALVGEGLLIWGVPNKLPVAPNNNNSAPQLDAIQLSIWLQSVESGTITKIALEGTLTVVQRGPIAMVCSASGRYFAAASGGDVLLYNLAEHLPKELYEAPVWMARSHGSVELKGTMPPGKVRQSNRVSPFCPLGPVLAHARLRLVCHRDPLGQRPFYPSAVTRRTPFCTLTVPIPTTVRLVQSPRVFRRVTSSPAQAEYRFWSSDLQSSAGPTRFEKNAHVHG